MLPLPRILMNNSKERKVSRDNVPTLPKKLNILNSSDHDISNASSNYNNKTFLNRFAWPMEILLMCRKEFLSRNLLCLPAVDESAFNDDLQSFSNYYWWFRRCYIKTGMLLTQIETLLLMPSEDWAKSVM